VKHSCCCCCWCCSFGSSQKSFPSKFSTLPPIPCIHSEESADSGKQLVPVQRDVCCQRTRLESDSSQECLRQLEVRVTVAERSYQALVEEMVCIQNHLK